jgi:hypothetical protein
MRVVMSAAGLFAQASADGGVVSVVDHAELTVTPGSGEPSTQMQPLSPVQPEAVFEVQVPAGPATFEGRVVSNNGTVLFAGRRDVDVNGAFTVDIILSPQAPVLVVTPDSLDVFEVMDGDTTLAPFVVENRGNVDLDLVWAVADVSPSIESCGDPCIGFLPRTDTVHAGRATEFRVFPFNTPERVYRVTLTSAEGDVELKAFTPEFAFPGVLVAHVVTIVGNPVSDWTITYLPCSTGSAEGEPGTCIPDEARSPFTVQTDAEGFARSFVAPGFWLLRPDPGTLGVDPGEATRFVGPGATVTVDFEMYVVL